MIKILADIWNAIKYFFWRSKKDEKEIDSIADNINEFVDKLSGK